MGKTQMSLSLEEVKRLLDLPTLPEPPKQQERLRKWVEGMVNARGATYVFENRQNLVRQWEAHTAVEFKSCL